ncbi:MAG: LamG-like jellyroll fold domain-containing protein [Planctomycetota bacterium]
MKLSAILSAVRHRLAAAPFSSLLLGASLAAQTVPAPVAHYPGEGSATEIISGNDGTPLGGLVFAPGISGQAFRFDGIDDEVDLPAAAFPTGSFSVEVWFRLDADALTADKNIINHQVGVNQNGWRILMQTDNRIWVAIGCGCPTLASLTTVTAERWYQVVVTFSDWGGPNSRVQLYLDGRAQGSSVAAYSAGGIPKLGQHPGEGFRFKGLIDEVKIYGQALTSTEVARSHLSRLYAAGVSSGGFVSPVSGTADFDGDGLSDYVIRFGNTNDSNLRRGLDGSLIAAIPDLLGANSVGDVNGDGCDDVLGFQPSTNNTVLHSGRDGSLIRVVSTSRNLPGGRVGDVDRDGYDDVLVSVAPFSGTGWADLRSGRDNSLLWTLGLSGGFTYGAGIGDIDGDGYPEWMVVDENQDAHLYNGQSRTLRTVLNNAFAPENTFPCGDVNQDGSTDFVLSNRVLSGADLSVLWVPDGEITSAGVDANADGVPDFTMIRFATNVEIVSGVDFKPLTRTAHAGQARFLGEANGAGLPEFFWTQAPSQNYVHSFPFARAGARNARIGAACAGSDGRLPQVDSEGGLRFGGSLQLLLRAALANSVAILNIGMPTNQDMSSLGLTGCTLLATADGFQVLLPTDATGSSSTPTFAVPVDPNLIGMPLAAQWVVVDASANVAGLTLSNSRVMHFGW